MEGEAKKDADLSVGLFVLIALIFLVCGWSWMKSFSPLHPSQRVRVMFHDVAGLNSNAAVYADGVRIGTVEDIRLAGRRKVLVGLKIDPSEITLPLGCSFGIFTNGLVGARYVEVSLPELTPGSKPEALDSKRIIVGTDPVRLEFVANKIAASLNNIDVERFHEKIGEDMDRLSMAADSVSNLSTKFMPVADQTVILENKLGYLSGELRGTSRRLNKILSDPEMSKDVKEAAERAAETAERVRLCIRDLNTTFADKPMRKDLLTAMNSLSQSTEHMQNAIASINKMAGDPDLRLDMKSILSQAEATLDRADRIVNEPGVSSDLRETLSDTRDAVQRIDTVADQINKY